MKTFDLNQVNKLILDKQHLSEASKVDDILQIAEDICGLHSTDLKTSYLSLFARTNKFKKIDLEEELYVNKRLARIRGMRRTLFLETLNLIPIVHAATVNLIEVSFEKFMEFHQVSMQEYQEVSQKIIKILNGRELSASEIRKELDSKLNIPAIIQVMCNRGLLIRGKPIKDWKDRRNKYALFKDYFPKLDLYKLDEKQATKILIKKYVKAYGPVTETDISWWTGLKKNIIREGLKSIESEFTKIKIASNQKTYFMMREDIDFMRNITPSSKPLLTLLPLLDPYPMGYKDRDRYIDKQEYNYIFDRSGNITSTIFLDGVAIGVWDTEQKPEPIIKVHLFEPIDKELHEELYFKAKKLGRFYFDEDINIKECKSMTPLTERNAGGFMTPLKNS